MEISINVNFNEAKKPAIINDSVVGALESLKPIIAKIVDDFSERVAPKSSDSCIAKQPADNTEQKPNTEEAQVPHFSIRKVGIIQCSDEEMTKNYANAVENFIEALQQGYQLTKGPGGSYTLVAPDGTKVTANSDEPVTHSGL